MKRRTFLKATASLGGIALTSSVLDACSQSKTRSAQSVGRRSPMAQVAFVKTQDRTRGISKALDLLETSGMKGKDLFLKPNFNSAHASPGSTHNDTLSALVRRLQTMNAGRITVGDRSGMGDTRTVMRQKGIFRMADELGDDAE
jgi:uncharacterized protein (DUF362 family)